MLARPRSKECLSGRATSAELSTIAALWLCSDVCPVLCSALCPVPSPAVTGAVGPVCSGEGHGASCKGGPNSAHTVHPCNVVSRICRSSARMDICQIHGTTASADIGLKLVNFTVALGSFRISMSCSVYFAILCREMGVWPVDLRLCACGLQRWNTNWPSGSELPDPGPLSSVGPRCRSWPVG